MAANRPFAPPGLPQPVARAIGHMSGAFGQAVVLALVNRALAQQIEDGLVDFLHSRVLGIAISDLGIEWRFTFVHDGGDNGSIGRGTRTPEAVIRADARTLVLLASRRVDPDTLFFRRQLAVEGDTELGLQAKNLLDTLEADALPTPLARALDRAGRWIESRPPG